MNSPRKRYCLAIILWSVEKIYLRQKPTAPCASSTRWTSDVSSIAPASRIAVLHAPRLTRHGANAAPGPQEDGQCSFTHFWYSSGGYTYSHPFIPECPNPHSSEQGISYRPGLVAWNQASISRPGRMSCLRRRFGRKKLWITSLDLRVTRTTWLTGTCSSLSRVRSSAVPNFPSGPG